MFDALPQDFQPKTGKTSTPREAAASPRQMFSREVNATEFLEADEEVDLIRAWQKDGDVEARNAVIAAHVRMAMKTAATQGKGNASFDDLAQQGLLGLFTAIDRFELGRGLRFSTYARWWVMNAVREYLRATRSLVPFKDPRAKIIYANLRRALTKVDIAANRAGETICELERLERAALLLRLPAKIVEIYAWGVLKGDGSLNVVIENRHEGDGREAIALLEADTPTPEEIVLESNRLDILSATLRETLESLPKRSQMIIAARYLGENRMTLEELSKAFGVSRERIRQIETKAMDLMRKRLKQAGAHSFL